MYFTVFHCYFQAYQKVYCFYESNTLDQFLKCGATGCFCASITNSVHILHLSWHKRMKCHKHTAFRKSAHTGILTHTLWTFLCIKKTFFMQYFIHSFILLIPMGPQNFSLSKCIHSSPFLNPNPHLSFASELFSLVCQSWRGPRKHFTGRAGIHFNTHSESHCVFKCGSYTHTHTHILHTHIHICE